VNAPEKETIGTAEIERRLFTKYHGEDFAICMEVRNAAGFGASRSCDALGIGLWPSRGCHVHGFEIKASRTDWLRELKEGAKAESFHRYCDYWHLVVGDKAIVRDGELPEGWGLLVPHGNTLREIVAPAKIAAEPMPRGMLAAFVKRAATQAPLDAVLTARYELGVSHGIERGKLQAGQGNGRSAEYDALRAKVDAVQQATGISIDYLDPDRMATLAVIWSAIGRGDLHFLASSLTRDADRLATLVEKLRAAASAVSDAKPTAFRQGAA
jgi:hypothetical protein